MSQRSRCSNRGHVDLKELSELRAKNHLDPEGGMTPPPHRVQFGDGWWWLDSRMVGTSNFSLDRGGAIRSLRSLVELSFFAFFVCNVQVDS